MHSFAKGSIIVYMDDDDYYPPERISHAVERLTANPHALCAGSSELYIYFKHIHKMYQAGPYSPTHATAGTFAFRKELLEQTKYEETASLAEEKAFLKDYTIPFVQLDPMKAILVFSHEHNTFDKRKLLENPHPQFMKESPKTVDMFIRNAYEADVKQFFMADIDRLLLNYEPGLPKMKPDVLKQIEEINAKREQMMMEQQQMQQMQMQQQPFGNGQGGQIMIERPGQPPTPMSFQDVVQLLQQQKQTIDAQNQQIEILNNRLKEMEKMAQMTQLQLLQHSKTKSMVSNPPSKTDPENVVTMNV